MVSRKSHSALLSKYLEQYKQRPHSRVFAPLAESYRKLGMLEDALKILKEGIKRNPSYVLGYVVLAQVYADQFQWDRVHQTLLPLIAHHKDNIALQKLFAKSCLETGELDLALETYKWLLFLNPRDQEFARHVADLEDDLLAKQKTIPREAMIKAPAKSLAAPAFDADDDDWTMVNFAPQDGEGLPADAEENWEMSQAPSQATAPSKPEEWQVMSRQLDDEFFSDEEVTPEYAEAPEPAEGKPLVSHTLVDLYVAQNHIAPAIDLLQKFLELNPRDDRSRQKLETLQTQLDDERAGLQVVETDGQEELLRLVTTQVQAPAPDKLKRMYGLFLQHIQLRADEARLEHV